MADIVNRTRNVVDADRARDKENIGKFWAETLSSGKRDMVEVPSVLHKIPGPMLSEMTPQQNLAFLKEISLANMTKETTRMETAATENGGTLQANRLLDVASDLAVRIIDGDITKTDAVTHLNSTADRWTLKGVAGVDEMRNKATDYLAEPWVASKVALEQETAPTNQMKM